MENKNKKKDTFKAKFILLLVLTIILTGTVTYGFFDPAKRQTGNNTLVTDCFNVDFTNESASINLTNAYPISDEKGMEGTPYSFTITNTCSTAAAYHVLVSAKEGSFDNNYIKTSVNERTPKKLSAYAIKNYQKDTGYTDSHMVDSGTLAKGQSANVSIKLWIDSETTYEAVSGKNWEGQIKVVSTVADLETKTIVDKIIASSNGVKNSFDTAATTDEGVFEMDDDYGTSYYYRGAVTNNYVKFGQNNAGQDMYWRIIRVNGDGSLRIIYDGTSAHTNGEDSLDRVAISSVNWNAESHDAKYVGYMYGGTKGTPSTSKEEAQKNQTNSDIKIAVDTWYKENIVDTGYSSVISDTLFCNDRSINGTGLGYGNNYTSFGAAQRLISNKNKKPTLKCIQQSDRFTVSDTKKGNGALTYPVGLITADEAAIAGGVYNIANKNYYLYKGSSYWSLTPYTCHGLTSTLTANLININTYSFYGDSSNGVLSAAPVINLSASYTEMMIGTGTATDPYRAK